MISILDLDTRLPRAQPDIAIEWRDVEIEIKYCGPYSDSQDQSYRRSVLLSSLTPRLNNSLFPASTPLSTQISSLLAIWIAGKQPNGKKGRRS